MSRRKMLYLNYFYLNFTKTYPIYSVFILLTKMESMKTDKEYLRISNIYVCTNEATDSKGKKRKYKMLETAYKKHRKINFF